MFEAATDLIDQSRFEPAEWLATALGQIAPLHPRTRELQAELRFREPSVPALPTSHAPTRRLLRLRARWRLHTRDTDGALHDAAELVASDPHDHDALILLGSILKSLGRLSEAEACFTGAVRLEPGRSLYWDELISLHFAAGERGRCWSAVHNALSLHPLSPALHNWLIFLHMSQQDMEGALALCEACVADGVVNSSTLVLAGHIMAGMGRETDARRIYQKLRYFAEDRDGGAIDSVLAFEGAGRHPRADRVRALFDQAARTFDAHLISLGYRIPAVIRREIMALPAGSIQGPSLDLGCGTGLIALVLDDLAIGPWSGVDLSPKMLEEARLKGLYADLIEGDVVDVLRCDPREWRVIFAADLFCYFDDITDLVTGIADRLVDRGHLILSVEEWTDPPRGSDDGYVPGRLGRFKHARDHVLTILRDRGFHIVRSVAETLRFEASTPVPGLIVIAERRING